MPQFEVVRDVAHSAADMFDLVADIELYPQFVPLCDSLVVRGRSGEPGRELLVADMTVAYGMFRETLTSQVTLDRPTLTVNADYLDGPFHHLNSRWSFVEKGARSCEVRFWLDYEFRSRVLSTLMGAAFDAAFRKFAEAFEARADAIYGVSEQAVG